ncbi:MAG: type IV secretion system protein VirB10 [Candidatus Desulfofervidus auxilii]|nr:type IV secretion system protein VirB10 [Candidatus Desulfofervidus auxilii]
MNINNEEIENEDEELLEESQTRNSSKTVFMFLGVLSAIIAGTVFYFLLKNAKPPVEVKTIERNVVKEKKFTPTVKRVVEPKKALPTLPPLPKIVQEQIKPKKYIPKIIKGASSELAIKQKGGTGSIKMPTLPLPQSKSKRAEIEPYTGGISTVAGVHHYDPNLYLVRGTFIPCSMDVRLISMLGGQITCTIAEDVYSANGNVLLIEKGSIAVGTYKKTGLKNGMNRLYAIWEDLRTPNNIIISLGSGASDELGSAGMVGDVDNHWGMRVGGAILLSVIDDVIGAVANNINNSDNRNYTINNTTTATSNMADTMLKQYINIPPTLYKHQGDLINIYVNKDVDFSKVYKLER